MIQIQNVSKKLEKKLIFKNLNWKLTNGKVYGLVGPNGSGKSTLLRMIAGVYQSDLGLITIDSKPVYENPETKQELLFISDDPFFFPQANITEMKDFYQLFYPNFDNLLYQQLSELFMIDLTARIDTFSKGMRRQASLILAFAASPKYLLLDEAFDGLDSVMRLALKRLISDNIINNQMTVLISSHNIRELEDICDEIALIQNGMISLDGDIETIRNSYHKYQLAFNKTIQIEQFSMIPYVNIEINSKFAVIVIKNKNDMIILETMKPLIIEEIAMSLEEIFVYKMKENGYGRNI